MEVKYRLDRENLYIYSYGELDEYTADKARREIDKIIEDNAPSKSVIFDFANLSFMDSTGIGVLLGRYKKIKKIGSKAYISRPSFTNAEPSRRASLLETVTFAEPLWR